MTQTLSTGQSVTFTVGAQAPTVTLLDFMQTDDDRPDGMQHISAEGRRAGTRPAPSRPVEHAQDSAGISLL